MRIRRVPLRVGAHHLPLAMKRAAGTVALIDREAQ